METYNAIVVGRFDISKYIDACIAHRSGTVTDITCNDDITQSTLVPVRSIKTCLLYPNRCSVIINFYSVQERTDLDKINSDIDTILINYGLDEPYAESAYTERQLWCDDVSSRQVAERTPAVLYVSREKILTTCQYSPDIDEIISNVIADPIRLISIIAKAHTIAPAIVPVLYVPRPDALRHVNIGIAMYNMEPQWCFDYVVREIMPCAKSHVHKIASDINISSQYVVNTLDGNTILTFLNYNISINQTVPIDVLILVTHPHVILEPAFHRYVREINDVYVKITMIGLINSYDLCSDIDCTLECTTSVSTAISLYRIRYFGHVHRIIWIIHGTQWSTAISAIFDLYMPCNINSGELVPFMY